LSTTQTNRSPPLNFFFFLSNWRFSKSGL
jgi:hypothetical protein